MTEAWLVTQHGARFRIDAAGVIAGRGHGCEILLTEGTAHRQHALFLSTADGVKVAALGDSPIRVNGVPERSHRLAAGDHVELPGLQVEVVLAPATPTDAAWMVDAGGIPLSVPPGGLEIGLRGRITCEGWSNLSIRRDGEVLVATADQDVLHNEVLVGRGTPIVLAERDVLEPRAGGALVTVNQLEGQATATRPATTEHPTYVRLEMLPRGGRVHFAFGLHACTVYFAERRFTLLSLLFRPPEGYALGEPIDDERLLSAVWPRQDGKTRVDLNILLKRVRDDLRRADLPAEFLQRSPGGGATHVVLEPGATVEVGEG